MHAKWQSFNQDNGWSEQGGYMNAKKSKLEQQFEVGFERHSSIFRSVSIYVNGYTNPSATQLRQLIRENGGMYCAYYSRSKVSHVIASRLPTGKINRLTNEKLVTPSWITESIKAKRLLPWQQFQLYPIHHGGIGQQQLRIVLSSGTEYLKNGNSLELEADTTNTEAGSSATNDPIISDVIGISVKQGDHPHKQALIDECLSPRIKPIITDIQPTNLNTRRMSFGQLLNRPCDESSDNQLKSRQDITGPTSTDDQLATFYARSRLHHLSSWANQLRDFVQQLCTDPSFQQHGSGWKSVVLQDPSTAIVTLQARSKSLSTVPNDPPELPKIIFHIDMDCFFVSVSLRNRPELWGKAVAVTHTRGSGGSSKGRDGYSMSEVASCSYAARKVGVRNGMLLGYAKQLCPDLITIPYDFDAYKEASEQLYKTVAEYTLHIQAVSCDELYADCTELLQIKQICHSNIADRFIHKIINPLLFGTHLRSLVSQRTGGCTASVGFGSSKLLARLATKKAKPDGQTWFVGSGSTSMSPGWTWLSPSSIREKGLGSDLMTHCELQGDDFQWFEALPLQELPGIGKSLVRRLNSTFNATTCGELIKLASEAELCKLLGRNTGERIYWLCRGRDSDENLHTYRRCKSVSASMNYGIRLDTVAQMDSLLRSLVKELTSRMNACKTHSEFASAGVLGRSLTVRVFIRSRDAPAESSKFMGHGVCDQATRTVNMPEPTVDFKTIHRFASSLLRQLCPNPADLRGLGVQMHQLCPNVNMSSRPRCPGRGGGDHEHEFQGHAVSPTTNRDSEQIFPPDVNSQNSSNNICSAFVSHNNQQSIAMSGRRRSLRLKPNSQSEFTVSSPSPNIDNSVTSASSISIPSSYSPDHRVDANTSAHNLSTPKQMPHCSTPLSSRKIGTSDAQLSLVDHRFHGFTLTQSTMDAHDTFINLSVSELREIFANWIISEQCPLKEDICILASYLTSLVPTNLERVRDCLLCLDRLVTNLEQTSDGRWRSAYLQICATVEFTIGLSYDDCALQLKV